MKRTAYRSLREWLHEHADVSQAQLARELGISQPHLSTLISGKRRPSVDLALQIEARTGVSVRAIVEGAA